MHDSQSVHCLNTIIQKIYFFRFPLQILRKSTKKVILIETVVKLYHGNFKFRNTRLQKTGTSVSPASDTVVSNITMKLNVGSGNQEFF